MENGDILNGMIKASEVSSNFYAHLARLNSIEYAWLEEGSGGSMPWIQADIGYQTSVTGIITQGDSVDTTHRDWFTKLKISTFIDTPTTTSYTEVFIEENGAPKVSLPICVRTYKLARLLFPVYPAAGPLRNTTRCSHAATRQ